MLFAAVEKYFCMKGSAHIYILRIVSTENTPCTQFLPGFRFSSG